MARALAPCGTPAAYQRHRYNREPACDACKAAHTAQYNARSRALTRLAKRYAADYEALFAEELAKERDS